MNKSFNYKEIRQHDITKNLVENVLETRNMTLDRMQELLNAQKQDMEDFRNLYNIVKGVALFLSYLDKGKKITTIVDCDNDGVASFAILYNYTKRISPNDNMKVLIHKGKQHGLSYDIKVPDDTELLIITDAGTNDIEKLKELRGKGVDILIIDHHNLSENWEEVEGVITINPHLSPNYENKSISGSGVTYKFMKAVDEVLNVNYADDFLDLAGMGCVADSMSTYTTDSRFIMNCAINPTYIKNPFLKYMINDKILKSDNPLNLTTLAWNVVPPINSTMRLGSMEEKEAVIGAFLTDDIEKLELGRKKANACKSRQDKLKKTATEECVKEIIENGLVQYPVIILDVTDKFKDNGLNGVLANNLSEYFYRPVIIVAGKEDEANRGSCRNANEKMCSNFREWCLSTNLFNLVEGHNSSFGVELTKDKFSQVLEKAKEDFKEFNTEKVYLVDKIIDFNSLSPKQVISIGDIENLWATDLKEPTFIVKGVMVNSNELQKVGSKGNFLRFKVGDFVFIKKFLSKAFYEYITQREENQFGSKNLKIDVLCKFKTNVWNDKKHPQLEIIDAYSEEYKPSFDDFF